MDTLTHALCGALVARLICARSPGSRLVQPQPLAPEGRLAAAWDGGLDGIKPWQAVTVGLVAGAFPDIDSITQLAGDMAYLQHHRGVTHSVLLAPLWALLIAGLMRWCFADLRRLRGGWKGLYPIALAAILLHIAGDWITQFGTMLLAPLSDHRFGLGAMFIIDLAFSGLLLAGLLLAALLPRARWPAGAGLLAAGAWVGLAWIGQQEARAIGEQQARTLGIATPAVEVMPRPASPFNWTVMVSDGSTYHVAHLNTRRSEPLVLREGDHFVRRFSAPFMPAAQAAWQQVPRFGGAGAPAWVQQAWQHEAMATYRWFALAPALAQATEQVAADGTRERCAVFRDLRFEFPGRSEPPFRYGVCLRDDATQVGGARLMRLDDGMLAPV